MNRTLKSKIMFFTLFILLVFNLGLTIFIKNTLNNNLKDEIISSMNGMKRIALNSLIYGDNNDKKEDNILDQLHTETNGYIAFYNSDFSLVKYRGKEVDQESIKSILNVSNNNKSAINFLGENGLIVTYNYPIYLENEFISNLVIQKVYIEEYSGVKSIIFKIIVFQILVFLAIGKLLDNFINRMINPIVILSNSMKRYGLGHEVKELKIYSEDEIGDVTRTFNNMIKERDKLQAVTRDFFNNATHELKTPITSLYAYIQILEENKIEDLDEEFRDRALSRMRLECIKLKELSQNLLDISRESIINKKIFKEVNLYEILKDVVDRLSVRCEKTRKHIELTVIDNISAFCVKEDIDQILINLIDNSLKYSKGSNINIRLLEKESFVFVEIENSIYSIPNEIRDNLLEPFVKFNIPSKSMKDVISSSGLGLYLCKTLAEANKGDISYELLNDKIVFRLRLNKYIK